jgi:hypothetical protein
MIYIRPYLRIFAQFSCSNKLPRVAGRIAPQLQGYIADEGRYSQLVLSFNADFQEVNNG